jgi:hypothetical protein
MPTKGQIELDKSHQLAIRRARLGVEILKRPSDDQTKYELFQRLNAGGTLANPQELRNCIMLMVNTIYFRAVKAAAEEENFKIVTAVTEEQLERQRHMEYAVRFLVHTHVPYDGTLDVENGHHTGKVGLVGLEGIAVGVAKNIRAINALRNPERFLKRKIEDFWSQPETANLTSPGIRGTYRIQRTVPFGQAGSDRE